MYFYLSAPYCFYFIISISSCSTPFLTEDGLFDKIRSSKNIKAPAREDSKVPVEKVTSLPKKSPQKADLKSMLPVSMSVIIILYRGFILQCENNVLRCEFVSLLHHLS